MTNDILRLRNMTFHAYHGVWDEEREVGQRFEVDIEIFTDSRAAGASDRLKDTVDLYKVYEVVEEIVTSGRFQLVEALAENVATAVRERFGVGKLLVRVRKPHSPIPGISEGIEVEIVRSDE
jgi:dihydroneopterin aldolase